MMPLLTPLSNWNPQFFREVKGRLKPRTVVMTVATSLLLQLVTLIYFWASLPAPKITYNRYCVSKQPYADCILDALGNPQINWQLWWTDLFQALSWLLPFVLLLAGVYMLIGDLAKEERRGTLNFIRLSPQTSRSILIGKLFGVPLLPLLGVVLAVPMHLWVGANAEITSAEVISIYLVTIAACCFFYTASVFYAFLGGAHGWLGAVAVFLSYTLFYSIWQSSSYAYTTEGFFRYLGQWYTVPIGHSLFTAVAFVVTTFAVATFWIWQSINRRFRNPNRVLIGKRQSYLMTLSFQLFIFGFVFREYPDFGYRPALADLMALTVINLFWFVVIIAALTPHRQTLLDWSRYRQHDESTVGRRAWRRALTRDLVWGEKSPALVAIALNLLIPVVLFTPWILTWHAWSKGSPQVTGLLTLAFSTLFLLICAALAQSMLFMKAKKRAVFAAAVLGALICLPPIAMLTFGAYPKPETAMLWIFSAFSFSALEFASMSAIAIGFLGHILVLTALTVRLTRQLKRAGESELKALMAHRAG